MNKAMLIIGIALIAILGFYSISLISRQQTGAELDYYLLKETTEAAMNDATDVAYYRQFGAIRMDKEKFMESFIKRFAATVDGSSDYTIKVYDINETPPKVSVKISSTKDTNLIKKLEEGQNGEKFDKFDITTSVDMILESKNKTNIAITNQNKEYIKDLNIKSVNNIQ